MREIDFLQVVIDDTQVCSYLPDQTARMPLEILKEPLTPARFDQMLASGYRRSGGFFYRPQCPSCSACEAIRLDVNLFDPNRSQRRALKRGDAEIQMCVEAPQLDEQRVALFNKHRAVRNLDSSGGEIDAADYRSFLLNAHCEVAELSFWFQGQLIAISILDAGEESFSAVYCFFDPDFSHLSLGTYAILKEIELARVFGRKWLYLGLYVAENRHLNYKSNYMPHQRRVDGVWHDYSRPENSN